MDFALAIFQIDEKDQMLNGPGNKMWGYKLSELSADEIIKGAKVLVGAVLEDLKDTEIVLPSAGE